METGINLSDATYDFNRRKFISTTTKALGALVFTSSSLNAFASPRVDVTVGDIMDKFIGEVPGSPFDKTVDTLKAGNRDTKVTGIVTAMFATVEVIKKTVELGANFIIVHEPTFYNHQDETEWLENDEVYKYKAGLLKQHNIAVWRNHDYIHRHVPDGVVTAVVSKLGWGKYHDAKTGVATLPATTLRLLIQLTKEKLGITTVRYIGNLQQPIKRVLLFPGAAGGRNQIKALIKEKPDVLVCGEIQEWETAEYIRDARAKGENVSLVVLGHIPSEEPGSEYMAAWLKEKFPAVKVIHVTVKNSLSFL